MTPDPISVRPTKRCISDHGVALPDLGQALNEVDDPVVADAQARKLSLSPVTDFDSPLGKGVIGVVDGTALEVQGQFSLPLEQIRAAHENTLPALFG